MQKKSLFLLIFFLTGLVYSSCSFSQAQPEEETITISTYYPAPFGVYNEMRAKRMAIGTDYYNASAYPWIPGGGGCTANEMCNADLAVQGNVAIGLSNPPAPPATSNPLAARLTVNATGDRWAGNFETGNGYGYGVRIYTKERHSNMAALQVQTGTTPTTWFEVNQWGGTSIYGSLYMRGGPYYSIIDLEGATGAGGPVATIKNMNGYGGGLKIQTFANPMWTQDAGLSVVNTPGGIGGSVTYNHFYVDKGNGRVGIGTERPGEKLSVYSTAGGDGRIGLYTDKAVQGTHQVIFKVGNTGSSVDDGLLQLFDSGTAKVSIAANNARGGDTYFNSGGNVGIGTTDPFRMFQVRTGVNRRIGFTSGISVGGAVVLEAVNDANSANIPLEIRSSNVYLYGALIHPSDVTQKQNIKSIDNALERVSMINGVTFYWRDKNRGQAEQMGVIAQDVEKAAPQLIKEYADGTKGVNYDGLNALTIEAIKEQQKEIAALRLEIGALKAELRGLGKKGPE